MSRGAAGEANPEVSAGLNYKHRELNMRNNKKEKGAGNGTENSQQQHCPAV